MLRTLRFRALTLFATCTAWLLAGASSQGATVQVAALPRGAKVEIDAIAVS